MNRYMRKPYRCNLCWRMFDTFVQAEAHWFDVHAHTMLATEVREHAAQGMPSEGPRREGGSGALSTGKPGPKDAPNPSPSPAAGR